MADARLAAKVRKIFENILDEERELHKKIDADSDPFADTKIYSDKYMESEHVGGEGQGYEGFIPTLRDKDKAHSYCLLVVTYDGAGYDYLSDRTDFGEGMVTKKFRERLKAAGLKVMLEHFCKWAFCVYED
jgi:hypothetical protein